MPKGKKRRLLEILQKKKATAIQITLAKMLLQCNGLEAAMKFVKSLPEEVKK